MRITKISQADKDLQYYAIIGDTIYVTPFQIEIPPQNKLNESPPQAAGTGLNVTGLNVVDP